MVQEITNILDILQKARKAVNEENILLIKELSDRTVHSNSIDQDPDNINLAVILYALSKIIERKKYQEMRGWKDFERAYLNAIDNSIIALKKNDVEVYRSQINKIRQAVEKLSGHLQVYIREVFRKARISKASRIYEHGISREVAAKILGITLWELNQYVGQTGIADVNLAYTMDIKQRIKNTEKIFS